MDEEAESVRIQGRIPVEDYEYLVDKFNASSASDSNLLRSLVDRLRRLEELEDMRATGHRPSDDEPE